MERNDNESDEVREPSSHLRKAMPGSATLSSREIIMAYSQ